MGENEQQHPGIIAAHEYRINKDTSNIAHRHLTRAVVGVLPVVLLCWAIVYAILVNPRYRDEIVLISVPLCVWFVILAASQIVKYNDRINLQVALDVPEDDVDDDLPPRAPMVIRGSNAIIFPWKFKPNEWQDIAAGLRKHKWQVKKDSLQAARHFNVEHIGFSYSEPGAVPKIREEFRKMGWLDEHNNGFYVNETGQSYIIDMSRGESE